jgi:hypothetical protein
VLAVQIPDITEIPALVLLRAVAGKGPWGDNPAIRKAVRDEMPRPESYYDLLRPLWLKRRYAARSPFSWGRRSSGPSKGLRTNSAVLPMESPSVGPTGFHAKFLAKVS